MIGVRRMREREISKRKRENKTENDEQRFFLPRNRFFPLSLLSLSLSSFHSSLIFFLFLSLSFSSFLSLTQEFSFASSFSFVHPSSSSSLFLLPSNFALFLQTDREIEREREGEREFERERERI